MDQTPPENPNNTNPEPQPTPPPAPEGASAHVDIDKILLPKKETPGQTPISAERVSAGQLLAQEQAAGIEGTHIGQAPEEKQTPAAPAPKVEDDTIRPLETYQQDIESVVQDKDVSVLSIATAEAERRSKTSESAPENPAEKRSTLIRNVLFIGGGFLLLVVASGALAYLVSRTTPIAPQAQNNVQTPFISVDGGKVITITSDENRATVLANLNAARQATSISLGLIEELQVSVSSSTAQGAAVPLDAQGFFNLIAPEAPAALGRSVQNYLLGVHVYNGNQPFIVARVDSYENAYAAMLGWENNMQRDLTPLFDYTPTQHIPEENISTTTPQTTSPLVSSGFVDKIIENEDARALVNSYGEAYLLWTFIDRNTLVITTNDATLREIISRLKNAPVTPIPGQ